MNSENTNLDGNPSASNPNASTVFAVADFNLQAGTLNLVNRTWGSYESADESIKSGELGNGNFQIQKLTNVTGASDENLALEGEGLGNAGNEVLDSLKS